MAVALFSFEPQGESSQLKLGLVYRKRKTADSSSACHDGTIAGDETRFTGSGVEHRQDAGKKV